MISNDTRLLLSLVLCVVVGAMFAILIATVFGPNSTVSVIVKSVMAVGFAGWWLTRGAPLLPTLVLFVPLIVLTAFLPLAAPEIGLALSTAGVILTFLTGFNPTFMYWWLVQVWRVDPSRVDFT